MTSKTDVVIVGGGLSGLTAAVLLARSGRSVTVLERAKSLGGRAATRSSGGFHRNLGAHALYRGGRAAAILEELGVPFRGAFPSASGGFAIDGGVKHTFPAGFLSLLTTGLLRLPAKLETARLLASLSRIDTEPLQRMTVTAWLDKTIVAPEVRRLLSALFRVSTYTNAPDRLSAGLAVSQLQLALTHNVLYLDGGWQVLVDGLADAARSAGARILESAKATRIEAAGGMAQAVHLADGARLPASEVVIAASPGAARALLGDAAPQFEDPIPVKAACFDVALKSLPRPRALFALGIDRPIYFSVHSASAQLAPAGGAMIHTLKYLDPGAPADPRGDEAELTGLLDEVQPGWRDVEVDRSFLPAMVVSNALVTAAGGGLRGRVDVAAPGLRNVYLAGDWVGPEGLLADASLASAARAAEKIQQGRAWAA